MRVLIIGLGSIGKRHTKALKEIDGSVKVWAIRSSPKCAVYEDVINIFSYEEAFSLDLDFAILSNPTSHRLDALTELLELGIPLFIEKPISNDLNGISSIIKSIRQKRTLTYVACNLRFLDSLIFIKEYHKSKKALLNEVSIYAGSYLPDWRPDQNFRTVYSAIPELGGGAHLDIIHEIDYTYWLFGHPQKVTSVLRSRSSLKIAAVDSASYLLEYDTFMVNMTLNYFRRDYKRSLELVYADETLTVDLAQNLVSNHNGDLLFQGTVGIKDTYEPQLRYFIGLVKNKQTKSFNSFEDGLETLKICLNE